MNKFIIVEHNLYGDGNIGHKYTNAKRIFSKIDKDNYQCILVTAEKFFCNEHNDFEVIKFFPFQENKKKSKLIKLKIYLSRFRFYSLIKKNRKNQNEDESLQTEFEKYLIKLFTMLKLDKNDIVYFGDLGSKEVADVSKAYNKTFSFGPKVVICMWHVLFSNPFERVIENNSTKLFRKHLKLCEEYVLNGRFKFYSDSEIRNMQYNNILGKQYFKLLPMGSEVKIKRNEDESIFRVGIFGGMRECKGSLELENIVDCMLERTYNEIHYIVQTSIMSGELLYNEYDKVRRALIKKQSDRLEIIDRGLEDSEYEKYINLVNVLILPYKSDFYYAYTSGPFSEGIFAGKNYIIPELTWMERQVVGKEYNYILSIASKEMLDETISETIKPKMIFRKRVNVCSDYNIRISFGIKEADNAVKLEISQLSGERRLIKNKRVLSSYGEKECAYICNLNEKCNSLLIEMSGYAASSVSLENIRIEHISKDVPIGCLGYIYSEYEEIPMAVNEIYINKNHYERNILDFRNEWIRYHGVDKMISKILE